MLVGLASIFTSVCYCTKYQLIFLMVLCYRTGMALSVTSVVTMALLMTRLSSVSAMTATPALNVMWCALNMENVWTMAQTNTVTVKLSSWVCFLIKYKTSIALNLHYQLLVRCGVLRSKSLCGQWHKQILRRSVFCKTGFLPSRENR